MWDGAALAELFATPVWRGCKSEARRTTPGTLVLRDARSGRLIGMARWEDEGSWRAGVEAMRAAVEEDPFDDWEAAETEGFLLEEV